MKEFSPRGRETERGSEREVAILREETGEGWQKWMSIRKSFIQPGLPPPAEAANKQKSALRGEKATVTPHGKPERAGMERDIKV